MSTGTHKGHRSRLRKQFLDFGLDSLADHQVLELLLFYAVPQKDTNPIAHRLLDYFGSLSAVMEASPAELEQVEGVGESAMTLIHLAMALSRRYDMDRVSSYTVLDTTENAGKYIVPLFKGAVDEMVYMLCLDGKLKVTYMNKVAEGSVNSLSFDIRKVTQTALHRRASRVILAHNHPSGVALPSTSDIQTTEKLAFALGAVGIVLADHLIVADDDFVSMHDSGHLKRLNQL